MPKQERPDAEGTAEAGDESGTGPGQAFLDRGNGVGKGRVARAQANQPIYVVIPQYRRTLHAPTYKHEHP
jgi:hypothetical protein